MASDHTATLNNERTEPTAHIKKMKMEIEEMKNQLKVWHSEHRNLAMRDVAADMHETNPAPVDPNVYESLEITKNTICRTLDDH